MQAVTRQPEAVPAPADRAAAAVKSAQHTRSRAQPGRQALTHPGECAAQQAGQVQRCSPLACANCRASQAVFGLSRPRRLAAAAGPAQQQPRRSAGVLAQARLAVYSIQQRDLAAGCVAHFCRLEPPAAFCSYLGAAASRHLCSGAAAASACRIPEQQPASHAPTPAPAVVISYRRTANLPTCSRVWRSHAAAASSSQRITIW